MPEPTTVQCSSCLVSLTLDWDPVVAAIIAKRDGKMHAALVEGAIAEDFPAIDACPGGG